MLSVRQACIFLSLSMWLPLGCVSQSGYPFSMSIIVLAMPFTEHCRCPSFLPQDAHFSARLPILHSC